jgi:hypothetical protein
MKGLIRTKTRNRTTMPFSPIRMKKRRPGALIGEKAEDALSVVAVASLAGEAAEAGTGGDVEGKGVVNPSPESSLPFLLSLAPTQCWAAGPSPLISGHGRRRDWVRVPPRVQP